MIGQIAGSKDAGNGGAGRASLDLHIAAGMCFKLVFDQFGRGRVTDGNEHALGGQVGNFAGFGVLDLHPFNAERRIGAIHFLDLVEPQGFDLGVFHQALFKDFFAAQFIAAVHKCDLGRKVGEE